MATAATPNATFQTSFTFNNQKTIFSFALTSPNNEQTVVPAQEKSLLDIWKSFVLANNAHHSANTTDANPSLEEKDIYPVFQMFTRNAAGKREEHASIEAKNDIDIFEKLLQARTAGSDEDTSLLATHPYAPVNWATNLGRETDPNQADIIQLGFSKEPRGRIDTTLATPVTAKMTTLTELAHTAYENARDEACKEDREPPTDFIGTIRLGFRDMRPCEPKTFDPKRLFLACDVRPFIKTRTT